ncbi:5'-nucleotidase C-terminal domain-containing protein [Metabacillus sp. RGM 3146]|uniref:5'-nucleotidase C-terminal domain-containing protein n=1 Tax=Metabacillus sp. RGM 3146 TaxID=3401092 RepID=UPI003B9BF2E9
MTKRKMIKTGFALTLASAAFVSANPAQAAQKNSADQLTAEAELSSELLSSYYINTNLSVSSAFLNKYNETKEKIAAAKKAVSKVFNATLKRQLTDRLHRTDMMQLRAARFIDAVHYGERLHTTTSTYRGLFDSRADDKMRKMYDTLRQERRTFEKIASKVAGSSIRKAFGKKYTVPAKLAEEITAYELTRYDIHKKALQEITAQKPEEAKKLVKKIVRLKAEGMGVKETLLKMYPENTDLKKDLARISANIETQLMKEQAAIEESLKPKQNFDLEVLHTNDTHAHLDNIARRMTAIKEMRTKVENSLLLDAGDVFSGTLYFNEFKGQADLDFMNLAGYDAMTFGNHEFDLGTQPLSSFVRNAKFPFVSANVNFSKDANMKDRFTDSVSSAPKDGNIYSAVVKEINGEKVGIFGLTTAETETISSPGKDISFENYIAEAKKAVQQLKEQGVNKIVALTHIGFQDGGGDNDVTLAKEVEGIDVIVGGHSHTLLSAPVIDQTGDEPTVIVQANEYSKYLGVLNVEFDPNGKVIKQDGKLLDLDQKVNNEYVYKDDEQAADLLASKYKPAIDAKQKQVVGQAGAPLDGERANVRVKETNLGNLISDGMLAKAKTINPNTVIALQNGGGIRASIDSGDITMGEILTVMPFGNSLAIMKLTGDEIKAALEHSAEAAPELAGGFLQVSGMKFSYDSSKPAGQRVQKIEVKEDGKTFTALDPKKEYFVATNTFTAAGGDNYTMFKKAYDEGRVSEPGFVDWEMFKDYLQANPNVKPVVEGRITDLAAGK